MPNTNDPSFSIRCPECRRDQGTVLITSVTVVTFRCAGCAHTWAADIEFLSPEIRKKIAAASPE